MTFPMVLIYIPGAVEKYREHKRIIGPKCLSPTEWSTISGQPNPTWHNREAEFLGQWQWPGTRPYCAIRFDGDAKYNYHLISKRSLRPLDTGAS